MKSNDSQSVKCDQDCSSPGTVKPNAQESSQDDFEFRLGISCCWQNKAFDQFFLDLKQQL